MNFSLHIRFLNMNPSTSVKEKIKREINNINQILKTINSCIVTVESNYDTTLNKNFYSIKINITLSNNIIISNRCPNSTCEYGDVYIAIWRTFIIMKNQISYYIKSQHYSNLSNTNTRPYGHTIKLVNTACMTS